MLTSPYSDADPLINDGYHSSDYETFTIVPLYIPDDYNARVEVFYANLAVDEEDAKRQNLKRVSDLLDQMFLEENWYGRVPNEDIVDETCKRMDTISEECYSAIVRYNNNIPYGKRFEVISTESYD